MIKYGIVNIVLLLLLFIIIILFSLYTNNKIEGYDTDTTEKSKYLFLTEEDTISFLQKDEDGYVQNMSKYDLESRNVYSSDEYIDSICECVTKFTDDEKQILIKCAKKADMFFSKYIYMKKLDCNKIKKISWKFALTNKNKNGNEYEDGFPHTRKDIIFLSKNQLNTNTHSNDNYMALIGILIHEKVHIFQRYNTEFIDNLITIMGYVEYNGYVSKLKRSNPDINKKVYYDTINKRLMIITYNSEKPHGINDINSNDYMNEHPFERMAYEIENEYLQITMKDIMKYI